MLQGGDYELGTGFGGTSVCGQDFPDENFVKKHDKKGKTLHICNFFFTDELRKFTISDFPKKTHILSTN